MKKKNIFIIIFICLMFTSAFISKTSATTVGDLKRELAELEANQSEANQNKTLTQAQINATYAKIGEATNAINQIQVDRKTIADEIERLNGEIEKRDQEMKDIINFIQVSNGESAYLEYAFGAKTFTDFIYRVGVSDQLTAYNDNLIKEYNALIVENNNKKIELNAKEAELEKAQIAYSEQLAALGNSLNNIADLTKTLEEEIKLQKEAIDMYQNKLGCKDDEDIKTCGIDYLPIGTAFYRPILSGYITSNFGNRCFVLNGNWTCDFHSGIDFGSHDYTPDVYSVASGVVAGVVVRGGCGGNQVYIHHNINGVTYTSLYAHLLSINVKVGDTVTMNTVVGKMGGIPSITTWDACSTGQHLHFSLALGLYLKDYYSWSTFIAKQVDPRNYVNVPEGLYNSFANRLFKY